MTGEGIQQGEPGRPERFSDVGAAGDDGVGQPGLEGSVSDGPKPGLGEIGDRGQIPHRYHHGKSQGGESKTAHRTLGAGAGQERLQAPATFLGNPSTGGLNPWTSCLSLSILKSVSYARCCDGPVNESDPLDRLAAALE
jgi:hypothetical protein